MARLDLHRVSCFFRIVRPQSTAVTPVSHPTRSSPCQGYEHLVGSYSSRCCNNTRTCHRALSREDASYHSLQSTCCHRHPRRSSNSRAWSLRSSDHRNSNCASSSTRLCRKRHNPINDAVDRPLLACQPRVATRFGAEYANRDHACSNNRCLSARLNTGVINRCESRASLTTDPSFLLSKLTKPEGTESAEQDRAFSTHDAPTSQLPRLRRTFPQ
jgi:hypothetical protein